MPIKRAELCERVKKMREINWERFFGDLFRYIWQILGILAAVIAFSGLSCLIYKSITADGKIDYCVIGNRSCQVASHHYLVGHRNWRADADLGACEADFDCKKKAEELGCHFGFLK